MKCNPKKGRHDDFNTSNAGQHAAYAVQILSGARVLSSARPVSPYKLLLPMLNLSGHGLELLLKACIYLNGSVPSKSGTEGHNVKEMWDRYDCEPVRVHMYYNAWLAVIEARSENIYPDIPDDDEIDGLTDEYVKVLAELHGMRRVLPLRYPSEIKHRVPRSPMLPTALHMTAEDFCRNSTAFKLENLQFMPRKP